MRTLSLPEGSRSCASRSASRASARARRTTATSGRRCCGLFGLFDPVGSWARTFSELLIGRKEWSSTRCALTWKRQDTKCSRTLYQLAVSAPPHRRDRCWFVAHRTDASIETMREGQDGVHAVGAAADTDSNRCRIGAYQPESVSGSCRPTDNRTGGSNGTSADTYGCYEFQSSGQSSQTQERIVQNGNAKRRIFDWSRFPTESPVCDRNDGFPGELAGISFPAWCRESIKACGNAIVPQVALQIFETINKYEKL